MAGKLCPTRKVVRKRTIVENLEARSVRQSFTSIRPYVLAREIHP
jgi:hypothetical protein